MKKSESSPADDISSALDYYLENELDEFMEEGVTEVESLAMRSGATNVNPKCQAAIFLVSDLVQEMISWPEILELVHRHWKSDPGENATLDNGDWGLESLFTIRNVRIIVYTDADRVQTNVWLE